MGLFEVLICTLAVFKMQFKLQTQTLTTVTHQLIWLAYMGQCNIFYVQITVPNDLKIIIQRNVKGNAKMHMHKRTEIEKSKPRLK